MTETISESNDITYFAEANYRGRQTRFGIRLTDRMGHLHVIGKTGTGKSTLLETLIRQDIESGQGIALLDPHGDLVEKIERLIPQHRRDDLIYFNVSDPANTLGFNPLEQIAPLKRPLAASGMLEVFKKLWIDSWGPRLEHILRNALFALLDQPQATLGDILKLLDDSRYRKSVVANIQNARVRDFWLKEFEGYPARFKAEAIAPIQNKVGAFLSDPILSRILTQPKSSFYMRRVMDEGKILLVNLSKGKIGEDTSSLLGAMMVSRIGLAALSRADVAEQERKSFFLYMDEFQSFTTLSIVNMLSELRKYRVGITLAHQHLAQLELPVRDAILGNVGTIIAFRLGVADAELMAKEFYPEFSEIDLINLPNHQIYLKLLIAGIVSKPFSATTLRIPN
jgi:hypothetical protein